MKIIASVLLISLFIEAIPRCMEMGYTKPEECFNAKLDDEVSPDKVNDYSCCFLKQYETSKDGECLTLKKSIIPSYTEELDKGGIPHYIFGCSENDMPDETKSNKCALYYPRKKSNCFTRSISEGEKLIPGVNFDQCCFLGYKIKNRNEIEQCLAIDSSKIEEYKEQLKQNMEKQGIQVTDVELACGTSPSNGSGFLKIKDKFIYIIWLIMILF